VEQYDTRSSDFPSTREDEEADQKKRLKKRSVISNKSIRGVSDNQNLSKSVSHEPIVVHNISDRHNRQFSEEGDESTHSRNDHESDGWRVVQNKKRSLYADVVQRNQRRARLQASPVQILKKKLPQSAVISITCGPDAKYADVLRKARDTIDIDKFGLEQIKARRAITGGLLLEVTGDNAKKKMGDFVSELRKVLKTENVKITTPQKRVELRVSGFDDSVTATEIVNRLTEIGNTHSDEFRCGEVRKFRGLGSLWMRCPLEAALEILQKHKNNKIKIGWCIVNIELLRNRPMQCFKCLAVGHPIQRCPSKVDSKMGHCINCGELGHLLRSCKSKPKCLVCVERGLDYNHRVGTENCKNYPPAAFK